MSVKLGLIRWLTKPSICDILNPLGKKLTVVVDFSSPNVAKPFHLGHFRATITGNFIRNVNEAAGHRVIGINYLGDWGSQFDLLTEGWMKYGSESELRSDPLRYLNKIYVQMNTELNNAKKATGTGHIKRTDFTLPSDMIQTEHHLRAIVKELTEDHLKKTYARMNVHFTEYEYESDYVDGAQSMVNLLLSRGIAVRDCTGVTYIPADVLAPGSQRIVLLKSNGNSLYLTRDLAAAVSRYERYRFDRIHYVVEIGQRLHFKNLHSVLQLMNYPWASTCPTEAEESSVSTHDQWHIPFGHVLGVSTRHGTGLFLDDILDNAQQAIRHRMNQSPNTRVQNSDSDKTATDVADHLGISCLVLQMLRIARQKPLKLTYFLGYPMEPVEIDSLTKDNTGFSGIVVQYAHARLCSLERRLLCSESVSEMDSIKLALDLVSQLERCDVTPSVTVSNLAFYSVVDHLNKFPDILRSSYVEYEPYLLVHYALRLVTLINSAWTRLPVIRCESEDDRLWRISLFLASRNVLALCLRLLGLHPLNAI